MHECATRQTPTHPRTTTAFRLLLAISPLFLRGASSSRASTGTAASAVVARTRDGGRARPRVASRCSEHDDGTTTAVAVAVTAVVAAAAAAAATTTMGSP